MSSWVPKRVVLFLGFIALCVSISRGNVPIVARQFKSLRPAPEWLDDMEKAGVKRSSLLESPIDSIHVSSYFILWLKHMENKAYPFAKISLAADSIQPSICFDRGPRIVLDTVIAKGLSSPKKDYLHGMLRFKAGQDYQQNWTVSIEQRLTKDGNYSMERAPEIEFLQRKARIYVYPVPVAKNQVMVLGGFQKAEDGKVHITGEAELKLYNMYQRGIALETQWNSPSQMEQHLNLSLSYPFLLFKQLGVMATYQLHKKDSTILQQEWKIGLQIPSSLEGEWMIQYRAQMAKDMTQRQNSSQFWFYGMGYTAKSWFFMGEIGMHSSFGKQSFVSSVQMGSSRVWQLTHWADLYHKGNLEWNYRTREDLNPAVLQYWGGSNSIRGFQDLSISGNSYAGMQTDFHILLDNQIQFPIFYDIALIQKYNKYKAYQGWGCGIFLARSQGNIALYYALGHQWGHAPDWRAYKIHIKYAHRF